jgi:hypothetical protein
MANAQPSYRAYTVTKREGQVRDNDGVYGPVFTRRVRAMGIRDRPISPRSPW